MPETVYGLPVHPLIVHGVVVLVPLVATGVLLMAVVPALRPMLRWPTLALALGATVFTFLAVEAGEAFQTKLLGTGELGGISAEVVERHEELGEMLRWLVLLQLLTAGAFVAAEFKQAKKALVILLAVVAVLSSTAAVIQVVATGHQGSKAVWNPAGE